MAKVLWQISFKSFNGVTCRIDIYDPTVPESAPISPMIYHGGEDPFYVQERDCDDLLNDVLCYHTGYIRIVDTGNMYTQNIWPKNITDRPVKVYYGSTLVFNGYIQPQDFSDELVPNPKEIEFPIISTLGVFQNINVNPNTWAWVPAKIKTLGKILDEILSHTSYHAYERVYLPNITEASLGKKICTSLLTPWNDDYHPSRIDSIRNLFDPHPYSYLIECICKAFGWVCHDTPTALVFTAFDYQDNYIYFPVGHIGDGNYKVTDSTPVAAIDLEDYFSNADDSGKKETLLPETGIEIDYGGDDFSQDFSFDHVKYEDVITHPEWLATDGDQYSLCVFSPVLGLYEYSSMSSPSFDSNGNIPVGTYLVGWTTYKGILVSMSGQWRRGHQVAYVRFYMKRPSSAGWRVKLDVLYNSNGRIYQMSSHDADSLVRGVAYLNDDYIEVRISTNNTFNNYELVLIYGIHLECLMDEEPYSEYRYLPKDAPDKLPSDVAYPLISNSVDMPISLYRNNTNMIGNTLLTTKITEYPYMFQPRQKIKQRFRLIEEPVLPYTRLYNYLEKKWRIVGREFHPWDDEYVLTLQHSPVLASLSNE